MSLGENIRILRNKKGYSILKVKELTGLSKSTISELETDKTSPTVETLQKIARALQLEVEELFKNPSFIAPGSDNIEKVTKENMSTIDTVPLEFSDPEEAKVYIKKHKIFSSNGINVDLLSADEILEFANALLEQMKMVSYKYKK